MASRFRHRSRRKFWGAAAVAGAMGLAAILWPSPSVRAQTLEYPIKAAFLFKFGEFVQWPPGTFTASGGVINICVVGDSDFAAIVEKAIKDETVAGRKVTAQALPSIAPSDACHIAYIAGSPEQPVEQALQALTGRPVLTVTDEAKSPRTGAIHFLVRDNRVRFAIDDKAAATNGLTLSSALLNIAISVQRRD